MKKNIVIAFTLLHTFSVLGQNLSQETLAVFDACLKLRTAIGSGNTMGLRSANKALKQCNANPFTSLRCKDDKPLSLDGHFVFDDAFIDSLIAGRDVYRYAQRYAEARGVRGASSSGKVFMKTCAVRKSSSSKFTFVSRGHQELTVVTEPDGMVTLRIHDKTHDKWYNDTKDVKKGQPSRTFVFELPVDERTILDVEVINCSKKDISFVAVSN